MFYLLKRERGCHFNPRPPWGGRRGQAETDLSPARFQSTPSVGRATKAALGLTESHTFQSTPSVGRATHTIDATRYATEFQSTPSVGRATFFSTAVKPARSNFNPRPPWGGRQNSNSSADFSKRFQSTPSVGRATQVTLPPVIQKNPISIHALRGEGDRPRGYDVGYRAISIHALRGEGDAYR